MQVLAALGGLPRWGKGSQKEGRSGGSKGVCVGGGGAGRGMVGVLGPCGDCGWPLGPGLRRGSGRPGPLAQRLAWHACAPVREDDMGGTGGHRGGVRLRIPWEAETDGRP